MDGGRWHRERLVLTRFRDEWTEALTRAGVPAGTLVVEIEPVAEPGPGIDWNWWISFSLGGVTLDAMAAAGLETLAFEDEAGYFDDDVAPGEVADHLLGRWHLRPRTPGRRRRRP
ncbi:hypothetical protein [Amycolatopsis kentuckyensis]|uniref:hypothetical protein n=1 Tax=Amycolatopsis kentuckyensis TaxID=218823 RepID=UPI001FC990CC|nr:hypothetical protein [Amycolatopsis kentuckyensis]